MAALLQKHYVRRARQKCILSISEPGIGGYISRHLAHNVIPTIVKTPTPAMRYIAPVRQIHQEENNKRPASYAKGKALRG
jgi:hypothetical protein